MLQKHDTPLCRLKKEMADRRALQKYITKYEAALGTAAMRNQAMRRAVNEKIEHIGKERETVPLSSLYLL